MDARAFILERLRERLGHDNASPARMKAKRREVAGRIAAPPAHPIPARSRVGVAARRDLFIRMAEMAKASVTGLAKAEALPEILGGVLDERGFGRDILATCEPQMLALPWAGAGLSLHHGRGHGATQASVALAVAGVAETGSLLFLSAPESPMTVQLLCDLHCVLLLESRIFGTMEDALADLRAGHPALPAAVTFVTGPSRTADIEQQMQLGAHGPRELRIYLAEG